MARTTLTKTTAIGSYGSYAAANSADLTMTTSSGSSGTSGNQFVASGKDLVVAHNTSVGALTITVTSAPDAYGRTGDIAAYSLGAAEYAAIGPLTADGWRQTDGYIYIESSGSGIKFGVVAL